MTKKKPGPADRHASSFMLRLPEEWRAVFVKAKLKNRRPFTTEAVIALEKHFKEQGLWPHRG
jgi:hypothetical protein